MSEETYVQKARREKMEKAHDIGIDDALISNLVETFYGHIQTHIILGPIFASNEGFLGVYYVGIGPLSWQSHGQAFSD